MWFPKFPYTNFSQINLDWVLKQVKELSEWMNRYFKQIRQDLDDEINNRIEGDKALGERIDQEITDRTEADQQLQNNIDAEKAAREAADTALGARIDKEIQDRTEADTALGQRIDKETAERKAADQQLQSNIDAEESAREAADTALGARIDKEIQDRTKADTALGQRIDNETTERKAADQQLQGNIDTLRGDAILKDGSTTTTAAIPFAQGIKTGSIAELSPDSGVSIEAQLDLNSHKITALANGTENTDAVNLGQMNTADVQAVQEAVEEANSYTDSQLEAFAADVHSIPAGGNSGQVLAKVDGTNYNVTWVDQQGGGSGGDVPAGGTTGQVLAKSSDADYQTEWINQPDGLPSGGTTGQVVTKTDRGAEWADDTALGTVIQTNSEFTVYKKGKLITVVANGIFSKTTATITENAGSVGTPYFTNTVNVPPPHVVLEHFLTGAKSESDGNLFMIIWSCEIENDGHVRIRSTYANGNSTVTGSPTFTYYVWPGTILGQYLID